MLQLRSGNEKLLRSFVFRITDPSGVGEVRRAAIELAEILSFTEIRTTRLSIVVNELATNLNKHADNGQMIIRGSDHLGERYVEIISCDSGPGIPNLAHALTDGFTTSTSPGTGLGASRRQSDIFDIFSSNKGSILVSEVHATDESAARARATKFRLSGICQPIAGESVSGDAWIARPVSGGVDIMLVDGLGHGPIAHLAATEALGAFANMQPDSSLGATMTHLHAVLRSTRGAAVSMARMNFGAIEKQTSIDFTGVGNVRGVVCEYARERTLVTHSGTLGLQYRPRPVLSSQWDGYGAFVMHSDGLQSRWTSAQVAEELNHHPAVLAATLFRDANRGTDDVTVVVGNFFESARA